MEKIKINENQGDTYECPRCEDSHCYDCHEYVEVDFGVSDNSDGEYPNRLFHWKGENVCPWCYNQLVDIKLNADTNSKANKK